MTTVQLDAFIDALRVRFKRDDWIYGYKLAVVTNGQMVYLEGIVGQSDYKDKVPEEQMTKQTEEIQNFFHKEVGKPFNETPMTERNFRISNIPRPKLTIVKEEEE